MDSGSWRGCCLSGVNLATPVYWDKPGSKLGDDDDDNDDDDDDDDDEYHHNPI